MANKSRTRLTHDADPTSIFASYDAASNTTQNQYRWQYTDSLTSNQSNSLDVRRILWQRGRYVFDNNTYIYGIVDGKGQDLIGRGPRLQMKESSDKHEELEKDWNAWMKETKFSTALRQMFRGKARDGESFMMKVSNPNLKSKVKLYFQMFEPERISTRFNMKTSVDGVKVNQFGEADSFRLLDEEPDDVYSGAITGKGRWVSKDNMLQYAHITRAGQLRGTSELAPALDLIEMLRTFTLATVASAELAANHAAVLQTDATGEELADEVEMGYEVKIGRNTMKALPYGWKMSQLKPEQPTTGFSDFKNEILRECARCLHVPWNVTAGDSSGYNYSSGQLDWIRYDKALQIERTLLCESIVEYMFDAFAEEWMMVNATGDFGVDHGWIWDGREQADPVKQAKAQTERMGNGTSNLAIECANQGDDWKDTVDKSLDIEKYIMDKRKTLGLPDPNAEPEIIEPKIEKKETKPDEKKKEVDTPSK